MQISSNETMNYRVRR